MMKVVDPLGDEFPDTHFFCETCVGRGREVSADGRRVRVSLAAVLRAMHADRRRARE